MPIDKHRSEVIDQSLDRHNIIRLKQRFHAVNRERLARSRSALASRHQPILDLLPLLLHTNHPLLPGYINQHTPTGISLYRPSNDELRQAKKFARSFTYRHNPSQTCAIQALFLMGSLGTIALSHSSDLDLWLCHGSELDRQQLQQLQSKCERISQWALGQGLEIHFFLMNGENFKRGQLQQLDSEASGSAQRTLLLDEFYRTALWLAGRDPLWWYVPPQKEADYPAISHTLLSRCFIHSDTVIDFGGVGQIPAEEFIGAGIWQLYKAIESPYKSAIKLLLLEYYASQHPHIESLAQHFKQAIYDGSTDIDQLDPYLLSYRQLEAYLQQRQEFERLETLRKCVYLKVNQPLSTRRNGAAKSWQRQLLEQLVSQWHWRECDIAALDQRRDWKSPRVIDERRELLSELTNSYRFLNSFSNQQQIDPAINRQELNILGRKLYAAYEQKVGKIDWINPDISGDISESTLYFRHRDNQWQVFDQLRPRQACQPLKTSRQLLELLLWCYCNQILTDTSRVQLADLSNPRGEDNLNLFSLLSQWLPLPLAGTSHEDFRQPAQTRKLLLIINLSPEQAPSSDGRLIEQPSSDVLSAKLENRTSFQPQSQRQSLVKTIDVAYLTNWNEIYTQRHTDQPVANAVVSLLNQLANQPDLKVEVFVPAAENSGLIQKQLQSFFEDIQQRFAASNTSARYLFACGEAFYIAQMINRQAQFHRCQNLPQLLSQLGRAQSRHSRFYLAPLTLPQHPLTSISRLNQAGHIQIFFHQENRRATLFIVDEKGSLVTSTSPFFNSQSLLRPLHYFIRATLERQEREGSTAAIANDCPQDFFGIRPVEFYELLQRDQQTIAQRRTITTDMADLHFFSIRAVATGDNSELEFTLYCEQESFSEAELGRDFYHTVARHVLAQRASRERYPCYITELDLSQYRPSKDSGEQLQTSHYLRIKNLLEQRINRVLISL